MYSLYLGRSISNSFRFHTQIDKSTINLQITILWFTFQLGAVANWTTFCMPIG